MAKGHYSPYSLYKRGEVYYIYFSFIKNGERIRFRESSGTNVASEAEKYALKRYQQLCEAKESGVKEININSAFALFWQEVGQYHSNSKDTFNKLNYIIKYFPEDKIISKINDFDISSFINKKRTEAKNATINRYLSLLSAVFSLCKRKKYNTPDISLAEYKLKEPAENIKYLKDWDTAQKIIDKAADHLKPIIYTAIMTGLRRGNLLGLKWENIDFDRGVICVKVKDRTKQGGKNLSIPISNGLKTILIGQAKTSEYVFLYKDKPIKDIKKSWHNIFYDKDGNLRDKSLPYVNFHTLRHTSATWILKNTQNIKITKEILGHSSIVTTTKYAHVLDDEKRAAVNSICVQNFTQNKITNK